MMDEFLDHFLSTQQWQEVGMNRAWAGIALDSFAAMELPKLTTLTFSHSESEPFHHNRSAIDNTGGAQVQNDAMISHLSFQRMLVDGINQRVRQGGSLLVSNSSLNPMENSIEQEDMPNLLAGSSLAFDSFTNFPQTLSSGPLVGPNWHHSFLNTSGVPDPIALGQFKSDSFRASTEVLGKRSHREDDDEEDEADQDMMNHIQGQSQNQGQGQSEIQTTPGSNVGPKLRMRARRGQATDPHSIAERNRRERIAERLKALQVLVPDANKTDKASMLDEIIGYVRFLQMQVKCLSVCRLGGSGIAASLIADLPVDGGGNPSEKGCITGTKLNGSSQDAMEYAEWQVARLMDEDMSAAMQYLQNKGLCLMPISLATAISTSTTATTKHQSFPHLSQKSNEGCASQESPLYVIPTPINMPKEDAN